MIQKPPVLGRKHLGGADAELCCEKYLQSLGNPTDDVGRKKPLAAGGGGAVALHGQGSHSKKTQCSPAQALVGASPGHWSIMETHSRCLQETRRLAEMPGRDARVGDAKRRGVN